MELSDLAQAASKAPIGTGLASMARDTITKRKAYKVYVIDTQSSGDTPMSYEEYVAKNTG
jgi:hypothetical protein